MVTTCRDGGRGDRRMEVKQESFQLLLHLVSNMVMMYASKIYCSRGDLDQIFNFTIDLYFILPVLLSNLLAASVLVFYHTRSAHHIYGTGDPLVRVLLLYLLLCNSQGTPLDLETMCSGDF